MPAGNNSTVAKPGSRLRELGLVLPKPPSPLGAYVEASQVGSLLFLSGTSNAGGLGSYGANDQGLADIIKIAADIRELTDKPFGLSLSVFNNQDQACQSNKRNH